MNRLFIIYLIIINVIAFALYGIDKSRAVHREWRIPEKVLLGVAVIGGSVGAILGMFMFRHKTQHWYFRYGLPLILLVQVIICALVAGR